MENMKAYNTEMNRLTSEVLKAISHPTRLLIVKLLSEGDLCVCEIQKYAGSHISTVSKHLSILKNAGLVSDKKNHDNTITYSLKVSCLMDFIGCIENIIENRIGESVEAVRSCRVC